MIQRARFPRLRGTIARVFFAGVGLTRVAISRARWRGGKPVWVEIAGVGYAVVRCTVPSDGTAWLLRVVPS